MGKRKTTTEVVGRLKLLYILLIIIILILLVGCSPFKVIKETLKVGGIVKEDLKKEESKKETNYPTKEEVAEEKARQDEINIIACIKLLPECENEL